MATTRQISPTEALDFKLTGQNHCSVQFPLGIAFWSVSNGGFTVAAMAKAVQLYISQHSKASRQTVPRSTTASFLRPIFPEKGPVDMYIQEIIIGKTFSNFRVELFQGGSQRICATADILSVSSYNNQGSKSGLTKKHRMADFSLPGLSLLTHWALSPPPARPVDLQKIQMGSDPDWTCWHAAYDTERMPCWSYIKYFVPIHHPSHSSFVEHWISPGWDHTPTGSRDPSLPEARFTTDMIFFIADMCMPIMQNFWVSEKGEMPQPGSILNAITVGKSQQKAFEEGKENWRESAFDGTKSFSTPLVGSTLSMSTEIKRSLPVNGTRWLYVRAESKSIHNGRMDMEVLMFNNAMELVAVSHQAVHLIQTGNKRPREASL